MYHGIQELPCFEGAAAAFPHTAAAVFVLTPKVAVRVPHEPSPNPHGLGRDARPQVVPASLDPGNFGKGGRGQASNRGLIGEPVPRPLLGAYTPGPSTRHGPFCRTSWGDPARDGCAVAPDLQLSPFVAASSPSCGVRGGCMPRPWRRLVRRRSEWRSADSSSRVAGRGRAGWVSAHGQHRASGRRCRPRRRRRPPRPVRLRHRPLRRVRRAAGLRLPAADAIGARDAKAAVPQADGADLRMVRLLSEAYRHCEAVAGWNGAERLLAVAGVPAAAEGVEPRTDGPAAFGRLAGPPCPGPLRCRVRPDLPRTGPAGLSRRLQEQRWAQLRIHPVGVSARAHGCVA